MSKHTPGPWRAKYGMDQMCDLGTTVTSIGGGLSGPRWWIFSDAEKHGDVAADARLIASAPDLLDVAANVGGQSDESIDHADINTLRATLREFRAAARAALSNATGAP